MQDLGRLRVWGAVGGEIWRNGEFGGGVARLYSAAISPKYPHRFLCWMQYCPGVRGRLVKS